jgi:hypothetical protein
MQESQESASLTEALGSSTESDAESKLAQEIEQLWNVHSQAQTVFGRTKEELRALRLELGRRLYEMKSLLACPGRAGQWSKFLSTQGIPRASADRYAKKYESVMSPPDEIASSEAIQESSEETARMVLQSIWPKLRQALTNPETAYQFLCALLQRCDTLPHEITDSGIGVRKPTTANSQASPGSLEVKNAGEEEALGVECE